MLSGGKEIMGKKIISDHALKAMSRLTDEDFSREPQEIQKINQRLQTGRKQFETIATLALDSVMRISVMDLALEQKANMMKQISKNVESATGGIHDSISETSAIASEVSKAHVSLTETITKASMESDAVMGDLEQSQQDLDEMSNISTQTIENAAEMRSDMRELVEIINHMNDVIEGINAISAQTNLLALNASIEAARAGDAGRGFAVVAEEIRKLADETKSLTGNMGEFLGNIKHASDKSAESVEVTVGSLETISSMITGVSDTNNKNKNSVENITTAITSFAAVSQEISSSVLELEDQVISVEEKVSDLRADSEELMEINTVMYESILPIRTVEKQLDSVAQMVGTMACDAFYMPENKVFIEAVSAGIEAHKKWMKSLDHMVSAKKVGILQTDSAKCGFGHFYNMAKPQNKEVKEIWGTIAEKHNRLHQTGEKALNALRKGDFTQAENYCSEADRVSKEVILVLEQAKKVALQLDSKKLRVFEE